MSEPVMAKALYCPGERGWVQVIAKGRAIIANCPFSDDANFNIGDEVELLEGLGGLRVGKILKRKYTKRSGIRYPGEDAESCLANYVALKNAFMAKGWTMEGGLPGLAILCHVGDADPQAVADSVVPGCELNVEWEVES